MMYIVKAKGVMEREFCTVDELYTISDFDTANRRFSELLKYYVEEYFSDYDPKEGYDIIVDWPETKDNMLNEVTISIDYPDEDFYIYVSLEVVDNVNPDHQLEDIDVYVINIPNTNIYVLTKELCIEQDDGSLTCVDKVYLVDNMIYIDGNIELTEDMIDDQYLNVYEKICLSVL